MSEEAHHARGLLPPGPRLIAALAAVQGALHSIVNDREVAVKSDKGSYKFKYATLAEIWDAIRAPCAQHGLAITQPATVDHQRKVVSVKTLIMHVSGEALDSVTELPVSDFRPQGIGSIISYARRYGLSSLLGVTSADDDDDANAGQGNAAEVTPVDRQSRAPSIELLRFGPAKGQRIADVDTRVLLESVQLAEEQVAGAAGDESWLGSVKAGIAAVRAELITRTKKKAKRRADEQPAEEA